MAKRSIADTFVFVKVQGKFFEISRDFALTAEDAAKIRELSRDGYLDEGLAAAVSGSRCKAEFVDSKGRVKLARLYVQLHNNRYNVLRTFMAKKVRQLVLSDPQPMLKLIEGGASATPAQVAS
jgi:hypothetical protein